MILSKKQTDALPANINWQFAKVVTLIAGRDGAPHISPQDLLDTINELRQTLFEVRSHMPELPSALVQRILRYTE